MGELEIDVIHKNRLIGSAHVTDLLNLLKSQRCIDQYFTIIDTCKRNLGYLSVRISVDEMPKDSKRQKSTEDLSKTFEDDCRLTPEGLAENDEVRLPKSVTIGEQVRRTKNKSADRVVIQSVPIKR
jgi:hypothetical protein